MLTFKEWLLTRATVRPEGSGLFNSRSQTFRRWLIARVDQLGDPPTEVQLRTRAAELGWVSQLPWPADEVRIQWMNYRECLKRRRAARSRP